MSKIVPQTGWRKSVNQSMFINSQITTKDTLHLQQVHSLKWKTSRKVKYLLFLMCIKPQMYISFSLYHIIMSNLLLFCFCFTLLNKKKVKKKSLAFCLSMYITPQMYIFSLYHIIISIFFLCCYVSVLWGTQRSTWTSRNTTAELESRVFRYDEISVNLQHSKWKKKV